MAASGPYQAAARLLNQLLRDGNDRKPKCSLKSLVYDRQGNLTVTPSTYALCTKTLQHQRALAYCLQQQQQQQQQRQQQSATTKQPLTQIIRNTGLLYAVMYDLLANKGKIRGGGVVKRTVLQHATVLQEAWRDYQAKNKTNNDNLLHDDDDDVDDDNDNDNDNKNNNESTGNFPRYVRVNTLRTTDAQVTQFLQQTLGMDHIPRDAHIPHLLVLPPHATALLLAALSPNNKRHDVVLQDKASCFSAYCLVHGFAGGGHRSSRRTFLDACAAPGNKTTHLAALVVELQSRNDHNDNNISNSNSNNNNNNNNDKHNNDYDTHIYALDRSPTRHAALQQRVQAYVPSDRGVQVHTQCADFLQTTTTTLWNDDYCLPITDILLDPSCSGSGIRAETATPPSRLQALHDFQVTALRHALTNFPSAQRVVYSTCSVHVEENEAVVAAVLADDCPQWELVAPVCLSTWPRRGLAVGVSAVDAAKLIRVSREEDATNGFFVACFQRKQSASNGATHDRVTSTLSIIPPHTDTGPAVPFASKKAPITLPTKPKAAQQVTNVVAKRPPAWVQHSGKKKKRRKR